MMRRICFGKNSFVAKVVVYRGGVGVLCQRNYSPSANVHTKSPIYTRTGDKGTSMVYNVTKYMQLYIIYRFL